VFLIHPMQVMEEETQPMPWRERLAPLLRDVRFWLLCLMSFGMTLLRSTFTDWANVYLTDVTHASSSEAALGRYCLARTPAHNATVTHPTPLKPDMIPVQHHVPAHRRIQLFACGLAQRQTVACATRPHAPGVLKRVGRYPGLLRPGPRAQSDASARCVPCASSSRFAPSSSTDLNDCAMM
jgi:hypothetical protein